MKKFRLEVIPAIEKSSNSIIFEFETREEMAAARDCCSSMLIFLADDIRVMQDYSNVFIDMEMIDGEWVEMEDDDDD